MFNFNFNRFFLEKKEENLFKGSFEEFIHNAGYPKLFKVQKQMFDFAFKNGIRLILGARGYGKTDYVTILGNALKKLKLKASIDGIESIKRAEYKRDTSNIFIGANLSNVQNC